MNKRMSKYNMNITYTNTQLHTSIGNCPKLCSEEYDPKTALPYYPSFTVNVIGNKSDSQC